MLCVHCLDVQKVCDTQSKQVFFIIHFVVVAYVNYEVRNSINFSTFYFVRTVIIMFQRKIRVKLLLCMSRGPQVEQRCSCTNPLALDGSEWQLQALVTLPSEIAPPPPSTPTTLSIEQVAGWAPQHAFVLCHLHVANLPVSRIYLLAASFGEVKGIMKLSLLQTNNVT